MALTLGVNSYANKAEADAYYNDNLRYDEWTAVDPLKKDRALITASGQISQIVYDPYKLVIDEMEITDELKWATCELALDLVLNPKAVTQGNTGSNTKRVKAGSAEVEYFDKVDGQRFGANVMNILKSGGLLGGSSDDAGIAEAFGTCEQSAFSPTYERGAFK